MKEILLVRTSQYMHRMPLMTRRKKRNKLVRINVCDDSEESELWLFLSDPPLVPRLPKVRRQRLIPT